MLHQRQRYRVRKKRATSKARRRRVKPVMVVTRASLRRENQVKGPLLLLFLLLNPLPLFLLMGRCLLIRHLLLLLPPHRHRRRRRRRASCFPSSARGLRRPPALRRLSARARSFPRFSGERRRRGRVCWRGGLQRTLPRTLQRKSKATCGRARTFHQTPLPSASAHGNKFQLVDAVAVVAVLVSGVAMYIVVAVLLVAMAAVVLEAVMAVVACLLLLLLLLLALFLRATARRQQQVPKVKTRRLSSSRSLLRFVSTERSSTITNPSPLRPLLPRDHRPLNLQEEQEEQLP
mmetsp:Transcript_27423/g.49802  ORF Transcript_27423/g.49802 Transcript_27423/m.49802 type:complete len:290 (+) Transcript_27423:303-1172(+)